MVDIITFFISAVDKMGIFLGLGGSFKTSASTVSTPNDCATGPSQRILIHRICEAFKGLGIPSKIETAISDRALMDVLN